MRTGTKEIKLQDLPNTYTDLIHRHPPRPIHDGVELVNALEVVEQLAGYELNKDQSDYLDAISTFIERYEESHFHIQLEETHPLEVLKFLMNEHEMSVESLGVLLGHETLGSLILSGDRALTIGDIRKLADYFSVEPGLFIE